MPAGFEEAEADAALADGEAGPLEGGEEAAPAATAAEDGRAHPYDADAQPSCGEEAAPAVVGGTADAAAAQQVAAPANSSRAADAPSTSTAAAQPTPLEQLQVQPPTRQARAPLAELHTNQRVRSCCSALLRVAGARQRQQR